MENKNILIILVIILVIFPMKCKENFAKWKEASCCVENKPAHCSTPPEYTCNSFSKEDKSLIIDHPCLKCGMNYCGDLKKVLENCDSDTEIREDKPCSSVSRDLAPAFTSVWKQECNKKTDGVQGSNSRRRNNYSDNSDFENKFKPTGPGMGNRSGCDTFCKGQCPPPCHDPKVPGYIGNCLHTEACRKKFGSR
jgi:hypothetical protein